MIQRALGVIAGVDRKTLSTCPASDKLWAAHLGASLCLSFIVVVGVSFHATGYMIANVWTRLLVSGVIGLTVLMFDRALCQSDWFYQGTLWNTAPIQSSSEARQTAWRFVRVGIRLLMSFGLAWVIAMFLELAIFSGTINEKIEADRIAANQPIYAKIAQYEAGLNAEAARRQAGIDALEALHRDALTEVPPLEPALQSRTDDIDQQIKALVAREADVRADIAQIDRTIQRYIADMNAEEFGLKAAPGNSGRPGAGPRYEFARKQKEAFIAQRAARESEIIQLHQKRDDLRTTQAKIAGEAMVVRDQERLAIKAKADALQARIDAARADLKQFEASKAADIADFRQKALAESYYQDKKDRIDPLTRIAAYQELKNDPKDGVTMTLFSWMTRLFIIFLEIVPVVAKIFFSPPSVYAAKIQAQVERARQRIENNEDLDDDKPAPSPPAPAIAAITLPAMSLGAVTMKQPAQPAPDPRSAPPSRVPAEAHRRGVAWRDDGWQDEARDAYGERRIDESYPQRGYGGRDPRRDPRRSHEDRDRRAAMHHEFDHRHDRDFDRRNPERRDYARRQDARYEPSRYDAPPRYEPAQFRNARFAAEDYAVDEAVSDHNEPEFVPGELDVRNLIMPKRGAARREPTARDAEVRETFGVRKAAPTAKPIPAEPLPVPTATVPASIKDAEVNELVHEVFTAAEVPPAAELSAMPAHAPLIRSDEVPADSPPTRTGAYEPAPFLEPAPLAAPMSTDQAVPTSAVQTDETDAKPARSEVDRASGPELIVQPAASAAVVEQQIPVAEARPDAASDAPTVSQAPKYSADVEKLMSEAVELSKVKKKPPRVRREAAAVTQQATEAELPLEPTPQYGPFPKA
ncbi:DUF4407 domain-containing protein [Rhodopseudomonas telluris]|uniref:DUF4407 domain-containing protein n=1 Tax=Rhodopseudomonas telluris TaxID=644215 RepID=A0ABV6EWA8_9BRAD